jgi:hypothetical protein
VSLKFPTTRPDEREIIEPDDLNKNLRQFTDEINGNLTHENLAQDVQFQSKYFEDETFTQTYQSSFTDDTNWGDSSSAFHCSKQHVGYIRVDKNGNKMPSIEFIAERDGYIIVDFMFSMTWSGTGIISEEQTEQLLVRRNLAVIREMYIACAYPEEVGEGTLAPGGWTGIGGTSTGYGGDPITGYISRTGSYVSTDLRGVDFPQGKWWAIPFDRFAARARVVCNGVEVCESGWLFNGTDRNSAFITGVIPVRSGRNEIKAEISAAMLQSIYGANTGVRAKTGESGDQATGRFFPNSFYSSRNVAHPLPKTRRLTISQSDAFNGDKRGTVAIQTGMDCFVHAANMIVQFRKA